MKVDKKSTKELSYKTKLQTNKQTAATKLGNTQLP